MYFASTYYVVVAVIDDRRYDVVAKQSYKSTSISTTNWYYCVNFRLLHYLAYYYHVSVLRSRICATSKSHEGKKSFNRFQMVAKDSGVFFLLSTSKQLRSIDSQKANIPISAFVNQKVEYVIPTHMFCIYALCMDIC